MSKLASAISGLKRSGHKTSGDCDSCGGECRFAFGGPTDPKPQPDATPKPAGYSPDTNSSWQKGSKSLSDAFKAKGGLIKGVHREELHKGHSHAGDHVRDAGWGSKAVKESGMNVAKNEHRAILDEMKSMPKPKLQGLARGGKVHGISKAGEHVRNAGASYESDRPEYHDNKDYRHNETASAKMEHEKTLAEIRASNPKLKGLAHGGQVGVNHSSMSIERPKDKKEKRWAGESLAGQSLRNADINDYGMQGAKDEHHKTLGELHSMKKPKLQGLAHGGPVDDAPDMDAGMDDELLDQCASELMNSFESKDKKGMLDSIRALVLSIKG